MAFQLRKKDQPMTLFQKIRRPTRDSIDQPMFSALNWATRQDEVTFLPNPEQDELRPLSIPTLLLNALQTQSSRMALVWEKASSVWEKWTYLRYYCEVLIAGKSFVELGFAPYDCLAMACSESPIASVCAMAAIFAGGMVTNLTELKTIPQMLHVLKDARVSIVLTDSLKMCNKVVDMSKQLPYLKVIITTVPYVSGNPSRHIYTWSAILSDGESLSNEILAVRLNDLCPNQCCLMSYAHGSEKKPNSTKGIMLSHDNFTFSARTLASVMDIKQSYINKGLRFFSYLKPGSKNSFLMEVILPILYRGTVCFFSSGKSFDALIPALTTAKPHIFWGNHSMWCQLLQYLECKIALYKGFTAYFLHQVRLITYRIITKQMKVGFVGRPPKFYRMINRKIKAIVGLNKCRMFLSFDNNLDVDSIAHLISLGIPVCESFSSNLIVGPHSMNSMAHYAMASVGVELPGCSSFALKTDDEYLNELCMRGRHVCMGIKDSALKTQGHVVPWDDDYVRSESYFYIRDGFNFVSGIKPEHIFLLDGSIVEFKPIENTIKTLVPFISYCMVVGHLMGHLTALLAMKTEKDPVTKEHTTRLNRWSVVWLRNVGCTATDISEVRDGRDMVVPELIDEAIVRYNRWSQCRSNWIHNWMILPRNLSVFAGEIDPVSGEMNRQRIIQNFENEMEFLYQ